jgi:phosphatidylglycerol:prolipoprotein diacylglycerol transferase
MTQLLNALPITPYLLLRLIAIAFALLIAVIKRKSFNLTLADTFSVTTFSVFGAIAGAKVLYAIGQVLMHGSEIGFWTQSNWSNIIRAGGPLYGTVLGVIGMIFLFVKIFNHMALDVLGLASIVLFGANFFSRIGCLLEGCCYGIQLPNGNRFPYQLTEGLLCALVFICFLIWRPEKKQKEIIFPLSIIIYSVIRFVLEFFRGDSGRGIWLSLSSSQWIAIVMIIATSFVWLFKQHKRKQIDTTYSERDSDDQ